MKIAMPTPAILPVPTRAARLVQYAWNDETPPSCFLKLRFITPKVWKKCRICTNFVKSVKSAPAKMRIATRAEVVAPSMRDTKRSTR